MRRPIARGFTLIEVLVAIAIFAVLAAGVYRVLSAMVTTQDTVVNHASELHGMQKAFAVMAADMEQVVMRDISDANEDRYAAVLSDNEDFLLELTRQGMRNPLLYNRSDLVRVAYALGPLPEGAIVPWVEEEAPAGQEDKKERQYLLRYQWLTLDRVDDTEPVIQVLLPDVEEVEFGFLDPRDKWLKRWPEKRPDDKSHVRDLPVAIRLSILTKRHGEISRVFQLSNLVDEKPQKRVPRQRPTGKSNDPGPATKVEQPK